MLGTQMKVPFPILEKRTLSEHHHYYSGNNGDVFFMLDSLQILESKEEYLLRLFENLKKDKRFVFLHPVGEKLATLKRYTKSEIYRTSVIKVNHYPASDLIRLTRFKKAIKSKGYERDGTSVKKTAYSFLSDEEKKADCKSRALRRVISKTTDYVLSNFWDFWCTFTFSAFTCDRYSRDDCYKEFYKVVKAVNRKYGTDMQFLVFPEKHEDGAWHFHGFLRNIPSDLLFTNEYGYFDLRFFNDLGHVNIQPLSGSDSAQKKKNYAVKYAQKSCESYEKGTHIYFCSRGLPTSDSSVLEPDCVASYQFSEYDIYNTILENGDTWENDYIITVLYNASKFFEEYEKYKKVVEDIENSWFQTVQLHKQGRGET